MICLNLRNIEKENGKITCKTEKQQRNWIKYNKGIFAKNVKRGSRERRWIREHWHVCNTRVYNVYINTRRAEVSSLNPSASTQNVMNYKV